MIFQQKKLSNRVLLTLEDDGFNFAIEDRSGSADMDLHYADLPLKSSTSILRNEWLRTSGYLLVIIGLFEVGLRLFQGALPAGTGFWLLLGLGCLAWARFATVSYSVFQTEQGKVLVMQNSQHDTIVEELHGRRKKQLLDWYGEVNLENEAESEINKFKWLCEQKVLTQEEAQQKISEIESAHAVGPKRPEESIN